MNTFTLLYRIIRQALLASLPQAHDLNPLLTLNRALATGQLGEERRDWQIQRLSNEEESSGSIFATEPLYEYYFCRGESAERIDTQEANARALMDDFDAMVRWMVVNDYLFLDGQDYVVLEKCLKTSALAISDERQG